MLAGHHGEFELVFTISPDDMNEFFINAHRMHWEPILIGSVVEKPDVQMIYKNKLVSIDTGRIRNLFVELHGDVEEYIKQLLKLETTFNGRSQ